MAPHRMAQRASGTDQVLVFHSTRRCEASRSGPIAKHRWVVERDYQELKQELGLGHYEGRGWRGFHHHATLCIAAYGFLVAERSRFFPSARAGQVDLPVGEMPSDFRARGSPGARGAA